MNNRRTASAFTLVELIVVMALLAVVLALSAPSLARSMRQRGLEDEAARFLAATEYARGEAVSQGVPMVVWMNTEGSLFGVGPKEGFEGVESREREFPVDEDVRFESTARVLSGSTSVLMEFSPEGMPETSSVDEVLAISGDEPPLRVSKMSDGWGYEITREER